MPNLNFAEAFSFSNREVVIMQDTELQAKRCASQLFF